MKSRLLLVTALFATMLLGSSTLSAQLLTPYPALDQGALQKAEAEAKNTYPDAILKAVVTIGNFEIPPPIGDTNQKNGLNVSDGNATFWVYAFYSPAQGQTSAIAVGKILFVGYQAFAAPADSSIPELPVGPTPLDVTGEFANTPAMVQRLATDTAFMRFRSQFPTRNADFAGLSEPGDTAQFPGFPIDQPIWVVGFNGEGDSSMFCMVASKTGEAFCQRVEIPTAVPSEREAIASSMSVYPNPARGITRIDINAPAGTRLGAGASASLYNAEGEKVLDLTGSLAGSGFGSIELDASTLPAGAYYCVVKSGSWIAATRVMVAEN